MLKKYLAIWLSVAFVFCCACSGGASSDVNSLPTESEIIDEESEWTSVLNVKVKSTNNNKFSSGRSYNANKEDVSIILVVGQSNSTSTVGYKTELSAFLQGTTQNKPEEPLKPKAGVAYSFNTSASSFELNDNHDMNNLCNTKNGTSTMGGLTPAFAVEWNSLTNTKVVFIQAAEGAVGVHEWAPDPSKYVCSCTNNGHGVLYSNAVSAYQRAYNELCQKYNIVYTGYIWNQGEHEEVYGKAGNTVCDAKSYYNAYLEMHNGLMQELKLDFGGISVVRADKAGATAQSSNSYTIARAAQYKLCADIDNLYMLSTVSETCSKDMMDQSNTIHYSQAIFNIMGTEEAQNLYRELGLGDKAEYTGVKIYAADGSVVCTFDKDGKLLSGSDVLTSDNAGKNIIVRVDTLGTGHKVEFDLTLNGADGSKYMDSFGAINWMALLNKEKVSEIKVKITKE